jgi:hypothetical protein
VIQISGKLWGKTKAWPIRKGKLKGKKGERYFVHNTSTNMFIKQIR